MITVKLMGGFGNQMFQYALAKNLAIKNNTEVVLDLSFLNHRLPLSNYTFRNLELDVFNLKYKTTLLSKAPKFLKNPAYILQTLINKAKSVYIPSALTKEKKIYFFDPEILSKKDNCYLDGFWQNEKYFRDISDTIKKEFSTFNKAFSNKAEKVIEQIKSTNSVSINFRRTDYVNNPEAKAFYGSLEMDYYEKAIKIITEKISNPHFFIFSDDINWCKENFKINYPTTFITKDCSGGFVEDFRLMSACKNFIIPNSTFSWWAAYLSSNQEKTVIAPKRWIADKDTESDDFIPNTWIKI